MNPLATRESLARLISDETATLTQLETLLDQEHALLAAQDIEALASAGRERQACVGALLRLEGERVSMCRMLGFDADPEGMRKLLAWCDPAGSLRTHWNSCASLTGRCRKLNDRNGALATAQLRKVSGRLNALTGGSKRENTYAPAGAVRPTSSGNLLSASV